ncbi:putative NBD/HSP70 family sugar kinase [Thermocatellispora tengchongensis]|uniref:Putative NBD/HSP70 family sugar kinase n=2 Tax=Thermocatellispora tengchongensis TaxID=1073253 RepID=A0A840P8B6_9ACTN|nr:ROK family protein [Thermocatellispora tengchongensis]MBB5135532.1 putative NBD/HSP70 family sugar kinase [Thermocatellispora tengchongensis]
MPSAAAPKRPVGPQAEPTPAGGVHLKPHLTAFEGSLASLETAPLAVVVDLVRSGRARTRPELVTASGLSRKIVTQRVEQALDAGLLAEDGLAPSSGGRQPRLLRFRADAGYVYAALLGASEMRVAVADLDGRLIEDVHEDWSVENGPDETMARVRRHFEHLARKTRLGRPWAIGVGVPGPVDFSTGRLVAPPIMPGWDGFSVRSWLRDHYDAPVWVDNDVNLMALGEWTRGAEPDGRDMLFMKVGTGVGAGLVVRGRLLRGQRGAAGDIGHTHITDDPAKICRCGRPGCLEAVASGWALLIELTERAAESPAFSSAIRRRGHLVLADVGAAVVAGDDLAREVAGRTARTIATVAANLVNFCNPGTLVLGGGVLRTGRYFLDVFREVVLQRVTDLAGQDLEIRAASMNHMEGVTGAALLAIEHLFSPTTLPRWVEDASPLGHAADLQRLSNAFA